MKSSSEQKFIISTYFFTAIQKKQNNEVIILFDFLFIYTRFLICITYMEWANDCKGRARRMWKQMFLAWLKVLYQHLPGETEETTKIFIQLPSDRESNSHGTK
jgi:hypothetical protein